MTGKADLSGPGPRHIGLLSGTQTVPAPQRHTCMWAPWPQCSFPRLLCMAPLIVLWWKDTFLGRPSLNNFLKVTSLSSRTFSSTSPCYMPFTALTTGWHLLHLFTCFVLTFPHQISALQSRNLVYFVHHCISCPKNSASKIVDSPQKCLTWMNTHMLFPA